MTQDELDRILAGEDPLEPSSAFAMDVMAAVRRLAEEPPPLRFPWLRFIAGLAALSVMAAAGAVLLLWFGPALKPMTAPLTQIAAVAPELGYAAAAVLLSLGLVTLPRLLARS
jgi:hypothetical protein